MDSMRKAQCFLTIKACKHFLIDESKNEHNVGELNTTVHLLSVCTLICLITNMPPLYLLFPLYCFFFFLNFLPCCSSLSLIPFLQPFFVFLPPPVPLSVASRWGQIFLLCKLAETESEVNFLFCCLTRIFSIYAIYAHFFWLNEKEFCLTCS